jgi:hypothetical protein
MRIKVGSAHLDVVHVVVLVAAEDVGHVPGNGGD